MRAHGHAVIEESAAAFDDAIFSDARRCRQMPLFLRAFFAECAFTAEAIASRDARDGGRSRPADAPMPVFFAGDRPCRDIRTRARRATRRHHRRAGRHRFIARLSPHAQRRAAMTSRRRRRRAACQTRRDTRLAQPPPMLAIVEATAGAEAMRRTCARRLRHRARASPQKL